MKGKLGCWILLGAILGPGLSLTACGGGSSAPPITVSVTPPGGTLDEGATQTFTASVTGTPNTAVTWSIQEGAAGGTITSGGVYTAPAAAGTFHIVATSQADSTKSATAAVTVPSVSVAISPSAEIVDQGASAVFGAFVSGTVINAVTWSVQEGATGGTVSSAGLYTAPQTAGIFHLVATSQADPTKSDVSLITVPAVSVSVSPTSDTLGPMGLRTFVATFSGTVVAMSVTWSILEGPAGGSITGSGMYTAPNTTGTFHVLATDVADPTLNAEAIVTVVSSGFTPTANMETPRAGHTATLLPNGKVLIAGGTDGSVTLQSAEIFDPATNTFSATGNMTSARVNHTATLLANGKVLLAGGTTALNAELYDPATGMFAATGAMAVARTGHTATLLADGRVLICGGDELVIPGGNSGVLSSAEVYDPASGTFTSTGSLTFARFNHAAALLAGGKVLVAGGIDANFGDIFSAELYDTVLGTFSVTGTMTVSRDSFTLTVLPNGKVLAAGGFQQPSGACDPDCSAAFPISDVDLYDASAGTFTAASNMVQAHGGHTATVLPSGNVLIVGGDTFAVEVFDPTSGMFSLTGSLEVARTGHTATLLNDGRVLVTGGLTGWTALGTAEIYK